MLRRDTNAKFTSRGPSLLLWEKRFRFKAGKWTTTNEWSESSYRQLLKTQESSPCRLMTVDSKAWWMFKGSFYWEDEGLTDVAVKALVLERLARSEGRVQRAISAMNGTQDAPRTGREPIPKRVRDEVWQRDGGKCVKCGSRERLEFDHIIPLAMNGSNPARNIELLCESCNRTKGASLG